MAKQTLTTQERADLQTRLDELNEQEDQLDALEQIGRLPQGLRQAHNQTKNEIEVLLANF